MRVVVKFSLQKIPDRMHTTAQGKPKNMHFRYLALLAGIVLLSAACATKRYGRMQPVTVDETKAYSCEDFKIEQSKVDAFESQVAQQAEFSALSIASFLGDFGIGNTIEKDEALRTAEERRAALNRLAASQQCP
jgi:hypothetical protein